ncbi:MerR family transcriptional regulator [Gryllotalpicola reticulitermitis]|uniref:MerR family transcriptional regulator n=1 Tax=Gryllotalpicola reticulitermitis TaxID=1184153 RepID=A0ABV8Q5T0_9MICO
MSEELTISTVAARVGLPESTLRYWERIGLLAPVDRDYSSGHRRYTEGDVALLETLGNLRAVGMSIGDMRSYLDENGPAVEIARRQRMLFEAHAARLADQIETLRIRLSYLELKAAYWGARERGDSDEEQRLRDELSAVIHDVSRTRRDEASRQGTQE